MLLFALLVYTLHGDMIKKYFYYNYCHQLERVIVVIIIIIIITINTIIEKRYKPLHIPSHTPIILAFAITDELRSADPVVISSAGARDRCAT